MTRALAVSAFAVACVLTGCSKSQPEAAPEPSAAAAPAKDTTMADTSKMAADTSKMMDTTKAMTDSTKMMTDSTMKMPADSTMQMPADSAKK